MERNAYVSSRVNQLRYNFELEDYLFIFKNSFNSLVKTYSSIIISHVKKKKKLDQEIEKIVPLKPFFVLFRYLYPLPRYKDTKFL